MAHTIEVLLVDDVLKLGNMGDIVRVKSGYARNCLLPQGRAILASAAAKRQVEVLQAKAAANETNRAVKAQALKKELDGFSVQIAAKVAHDRHLFGSVGIRDIVRALSAGGFDIDQRQVHLHENFKELGTYEVLIKLHTEVEATITVEVVDADPQGKALDEVLEETAEQDA